MEKTPKTALRIGLQTIMNVKQTILLAKGLNKSEIINKVIEGSVCGVVTLSVLQTHPKTAIVCDELAAYELKLKTIKYFENMHDEYATLEK